MTRLPKPAQPAPDWNVLVTLPENTYREARKLLSQWGKLRHTGYFNVLTLSVDDPMRFLEAFGEAMLQSPGIGNIVSHVMPAQVTFDFATTAEFESSARETALGWLSALANKTFHVRLHRRGLKGVLATLHEERFLDEAVLSALATAGAPGRIEFEDPDAMIQIETIGGRAGMSLWRREDLRRYDFLGWR